MNLSPLFEALLERLALNAPEPPEPSPAPEPTCRPDGGEQMLGAEHRAPGQTDVRAEHRAPGRAEHRAPGRAEHRAPGIKTLFQDSNQDFFFAPPQRECEPQVSAPTQGDGSPSHKEDEDALAALPAEVVEAWREFGDRPLGHVDALLQRLAAEHGAAAVVEAIRESAATTHARDGKAHVNHVKALVLDKARAIRQQEQQEREKQERWLFCEACDIHFSSLEGHDCQAYRQRIVDQCPWKRLADWPAPPRPPVPPVGLLRPDGHTTNRASHFSGPSA